MNEGDKIKASAIVTGLICVGFIAFFILPVVWWGDDAALILMLAVLLMASVCVIFIGVYAIMFDPPHPPHDRRGQ